MQALGEALRSLLSNIPLLAGMFGWFAAEIIKILINSIRSRSLKHITMKDLFASGGMPSSHAAAMCALTTATAIRFGLDHPSFAVCIVVSFIVMYDAMGVRHETGEQAKALNLIFRDMFSNNPEYQNHAFKELVGHTKVQVFVGAALGVALGAVCGVFMA